MTTLNGEFDSPDVVRPGRTRRVNGRYRDLPRADGSKQPSQGWMSVTNFAGSIEDRRALSLHEQHKILQGVHDRPDVVDEMIALVDPDRATLLSYAGRFSEIAKANVGSNNGTLRHNQIEAAHAGQPFRARPRLIARVDNYMDALKAADLTPVQGMDERVILNEEFGVAGRLDCVLRDEAWGVYRIGDAKTAKAFYSWMSMAVQLWLYATAPVVWDEAADRWVDMPYPIDPSTALINWVPEDHPDRENGVDLYELDIFHGRRLSELIVRVLAERFDSNATPTKNRVPWGRVRLVADQALTLTERYAARLRSAGSEAEVKAVGAAARQAGAAMDALLPIGRARLAELGA